MQRNGDGRTVAHAIQCHFCDDIVDVAHAQQADGQPARRVALCATGEDSGVFEMVCKERGGRIELSGGVLGVLGYRVSWGVGAWERRTLKFLSGMARMWRSGCSRTLSAMSWFKERMSGVMMGGHGAWWSS